MKKEEFVNVYADAVRDGRKGFHPDMIPSEVAASRMGDMETARKLWHKHRAKMSAMTANELKAWLTLAASPNTTLAYVETQ